MEGSDSVLSQKFVLPSASQLSYVQGALLLVSPAPVTQQYAYPAVLVQHPFGTCVKGVKEDVVVDCCWTYHGVRGMRMSFSMAPPSGWSGTWVVAMATILRWSCVALSNCSPCSAVA